MGVDYGGRPGAGLLGVRITRHRIDGSPYRYADSPLELAESVDLLVVAAAGGARHLVDRAVLEALGP